MMTTVIVLEHPEGGAHGRLRRNFVPTIRAAVRFLEPLLETMVAEDVLALRQA
jgi:hypothetical protein